ncbi:MAG: hypothetical protein M3433_03330 [Actinomycetota bacterium]|nr:hypothetical protein [Actinomycetota bacterium]
MIAAGVDLSGRTVGTTATAWLEGERPERPHVVEVKAGRDLRGNRGDHSVVSALIERRPKVVAVDAPLSLPHTVTCTDSRCDICFPETEVAPAYGSRAIDLSEEWRKRGHEEKPPMATAMVAGIAFRAMYLRRLLQKRGLSVVETWPMRVYGPSRGPAEPVEWLAKTNGGGRCCGVL